MDSPAEDLDQEATNGRYRLEDSVGHLLRRAQQRHVAMFQAQAAEFGLTPPQFAVLVKLAEQGRATQNRLGRLVAMDSATIQGVVRRLLARGFVATGSDPMDRRAVVIEPTEAGLAIAAQAAPRAQAANDAVLDALSGRERRLFLDLLRRVAGA